MSDSGAVLVVQEGTRSQEVMLGERPLTLGRAHENDVVLPSLFVSQRHARIEPEGPAHRIVDTGSTNGLLYRGQRIPVQHSLRDGDVLRIGDPSTGSFVTLTYHNRQVPRADRSEATRSYALDPHDPAITLGRWGCEINLDNPQVSRFHAWLGRLPSGRHMLRDVGSTNGTFVNGQRISEHELRPGDVIQIGVFKLVYKVTSLDQYDQQGELRIAARNIAYDVQEGRQTRRILHEVSLCIEPREFVALVGGSGAGKSTLLKALNGYERATSGQVQINGDDFYRNFDAYRPGLGYVPQDEVLHQTLPVERALSYTARLRLPPDTSNNEIAQRISEVLSDVEMTHRRKQRIQQLSGGQRKRVGIGAELLSNPSLFFLDEPTSGLDPGLERKMMYTLRRLADSGRTVITVTHATENITQCDHVVFLAGGRLVYFGPPARALDFFAISSGDFADIYTKLEGTADPEGAIVQNDLSAEYAAWQLANPHSLAPPALAELWQAKFTQSVYYQRYITDRLNRAPQGPVVAQQAPAARRAPRISLLRQFGIIARRSIDVMLQDRANLAILLLQSPFIALLLLLLISRDALTGAQAVGLVQRGEAARVLFLLTIVSIWFGIINAAREITRETAVFRHECLVNLRTSAYVAAKTAILALLALLQTLLLLAVLSAGLHYPAVAGLLLPLPLELTLTFLLAALAGMVLGLVISAASATPERALSLVPIVLILQIVFSGQVFPVEGPVNEAVSLLTISRWAMDAAGSSINLNMFCDLPNISYQGAGRPPMACNLGTLQQRPDETLPGAFVYSGGHLLQRWGILLSSIVLSLGLAAWLLAHKDQRASSARPFAAAARALRRLPARIGRSAGKAAPLPAPGISGTPPPEDGAGSPTPARKRRGYTTFQLPETLAADGEQQQEHRPATHAIYRYQIEQELGRRGMFVVYRAYDPHMKRPVAIKVLQPQFCNPATNARFQQEAYLVATLEHPCIVRVYDFGEVDGQPFIVMRYLQGRTLAARLAEEVLTLHKLVPIVERVAAALDEAHARLVLHQNLKPANILFDEQGQAFLADFGINVSIGSAEISSDLSAQGIFDANYLSPEQVALITGSAATTRPSAPPPASISPHSDIYALGAIVFHALTGRPPYESASPQDTALAHLAKPVPLIAAFKPGLPRGCQNIIERVLAKDPAARYSTAGEFAHELRELASGRWLLHQMGSASREAAMETASPGRPAQQRISAADFSPPAMLQARHIGRYILEHQLGQGGMGVVHLAYDPAMQRRIAIKLLPAHYSSIPGFSARFRQEAEMVAALEHDCIVQVYDLGEHESQPFLVMQYMPGGTLSDQLEHGPLPLRTAASIIERVARALELAHQRQIIHQDIKPANILFDERSQAYLSDFGIAVIVEASAGRSGRRAVGGTPGYMSPEQAQAFLAPAASGAAITPRSDIYALGVVLFQALTGHLPYEGSSTLEVAQRHVHASVPRLQILNPALPAACQEIVDRALAKDPAARYPTASSLARDISDLARGRWHLRRI